LFITKEEAKPFQDLTWLSVVYFPIYGIKFNLIYPPLVCRVAIAISVDQFQKIHENWTAGAPREAALAAG
jgi:hypothetical protein